MNNFIFLILTILYYNTKLFLSGMDLRRIFTVVTFVRLICLYLPQHRFQDKEGLCFYRPFRKRSTIKEADIYLT